MGYGFALLKSGVFFFYEITSVSIIYKITGNSMSFYIENLMENKQLIPQVAEWIFTEFIEDKGSPSI